MKKKPSSLILATLYAIFALDLAGMAIVLVLFAPLIFENSPLISPTATIGERNIILGLLLAIYPLAQFFGAPLLGELSDRFGRKWPLFFSTLFTALTFLLSALALIVGNLSLLFLSRFLGGLTAGNMTIAQASVSDLVAEKQRPRYMSIFNIVSGLSWTVAPYIGSVLSNSHYVTWFSPAVPFWILALLFFIMAFLVFYKFEDVVQTLTKQLKIVRIFKDLIKTLHVPKIAPLLLISVLTTFGWIMYQGFMSAYLVQRYNFSMDWVGKTFTFFSAGWFIGGLLANQWLFKKYHSSQVNLLPMLITPLAVLSYIFFSRSLGMWYASAIANITQSIATCCFFSLFSIMAPTHIQGKVFGFWNAGLALSFTITPIVAGFLAAYSIALPFLIAAAILFLACILYIRWYWQYKKALHDTL